MKSVYEKAFVWGVVGPLGAYIIALKLYRVVMTVDITTSWDLLLLIRSDVLLLVAFTALGLFVLRYLERWIRFSFLLWFLQLVAIVWMFLEAVAHQFYTVTGSFFDAYLLAFSVATWKDTFSVVGSEAPLSYALTLSVFLLTILILPRFLLRKYDFATKKGRIYKEGFSWQFHAAPLIVCFVSGLIATLPAKGNGLTSISRSNLVNFVGAFDQAMGLTPELVARQPLDELYLSPDESGAVNRKEPRNLVFIILESTRAKSTTIHNPELKTTPYLAELAKDSLVASDAYAVVPHTSKALVAILCGIEPRLNMPITESLAGGIPAPCLASMLGDVGYKSVFFQPATQRFENRGGLVFNMGYEDFIPLEKMDASGFEKANYFGPEDAVMLEPSEEWLKTNADEAPFFATYLTLSPHHNYLAPRKRYGYHEFAEEKEFNNYLNTLHYLDQFVRELMEQYKRLGLYENTLFVILGDHGEAFGEHGRYQHDNVMWQEGLHVPLLIHDPEKALQGTISHPVTQLDLLPSVANLLGYEIQGEETPGRLLWQETPERTLYAHCWYEKQCMAAISGGYKVIHHFGKHPVEVYNLQNDPEEARNLAPQFDRSQLNERKAAILGWRMAVNRLYEKER